MRKTLLLGGCLMILCSCAGLQNPPKPAVREKLPVGGSEKIIPADDGTGIYVYKYVPSENRRATIYLTSGITGINHIQEHDVIEMLSSAAGGCRVVVIHPRGTGYSGGTRGDIRNFDRFINDYADIIRADIADNGNMPFFLFGHSMSSALCLELAVRLHKASVDEVYSDELRRSEVHRNAAGVIIVNPPYKLKKAEGMTPGISDFIKYAGYSVFAPHVPIVDMGGDPSLIKNEDEKQEALRRRADPLITRYFSMHMMMESRKMMSSMNQNAQKAESPLLLLYGTADGLVDRKGCEQIFSSWKSKDKIFLEVENGPHGKATVIMAADRIRGWIEDKIE